MVSNFRSIGEPGVNLELKPLTLLFGPQGAGKSNILEAFWRLAKLHEERAGSYTTPDIHRLVKRNDDIHKGDLRRILRIGICVTVNDNKVGEWVIEFRRGDEEIKRITSQEVILDNKTIMKIGVIPTNHHSYKPLILFPEGYEDQPLNYYPSELRPDVFTIVKPDIPQKLKVLSETAQRITYTIVRTLTGRHVTKVGFLRSLRGLVDEKVETSKEVEYEGEVYPIEPDGRNLIHYLSFIRESPRYTKHFSFIDKWSAEFGLADLRAGFRGAHTLSADFRDKDLNVTPNLAYASHGARQILCIIAQLFSPTQEIILIEEPEISLHPESVAKLPLMFLDAIRMGKQIIATTHSPILPLALSRMVKKAKEERLCENPNELIAVYEVEKDREGTKAKRLMLDERGYIRGYIESFYKIERELLREWEEELPEALSKE